MSPQPAVPARRPGGFCVWFTGLPCAGKSTLAGALSARLRDRGHAVTLLDGDAVRRRLLPDLGFTREDRIAANARMAAMAAEAVQRRQIAVCAAVSPFAEGRRRARERVGVGRFVLVYVDTPLDRCERRDVKGLYARARRGELRGFTGVDDPYEVPVDADVRIAAAERSPAACVEQVLAWLGAAGFLRRMSRRRCQDAPS